MLEASAVLGDKTSLIRLNQFVKKDKLPLFRPKTYQNYLPGIEVNHNVDQKKLSENNIMGTFSTAFESCQADSGNRKQKK